MIAAAVLSGFVLAGAAPWLTRRLHDYAGWCLAALPLLLSGYFGVWFAEVIHGGGTSIGYPWMPALGLHLSFLLDGLSLLFALLIAGMGALVLIYAGGYLAGHPFLGRLYAFLLLFMGSMLGVVLADNVLTLFIFWELTSISSYLLIGFDHERPAARAAALQALLVTGGGGLALMAGLLLLGHVGGTYELSELFARGDQVREHALYLPIMVLVLAGAFTKSAQFPFHFWLPSAMEAPTPVSAYLHSATMVKAGVYLIARLTPVLGGTEGWTAVVTGAGAVTMLVGALLAAPQTDLKRILAYTTVSALGLLTLTIGVGTGPALLAAILFLVAHALYKGALFLVAGAIDHETGTRDVTGLGGLSRRMPVTAAAAFVAALAMAGLPPLFGFIAKETFYTALLETPAGLLAIACGVAASMLFVALALVVGVRPFFTPNVATPKHPHEAPPSLLLGPVLLGVAGLVFGLAPTLVEAPLSAAVAAILQREPAPLHLALWHGWNTALYLSIATVAGGLVLFWLRGSMRAGAERLAPLGGLGPAGGYELGLRGLNALAAAQTHLLQSGYLRYYLMIVLATVIGLTGYALWRRPLGLQPPVWDDGAFYDAGLVVIIIVAALASVRSQPRLAAIATLGVVGYSVALFFVIMGAPDLAMTQFLIETLTVILFVLVFYHLPSLPDQSQRTARLRDALLAAGAGLIMAVLVLITTQMKLFPNISDYHGEHSVTKAHGRNVVNVILVDYRGLDTLGEITVLGVAAAGVYALLKLRPSKPREGPGEASP
jgi:multicomponent Na+:H+ antiporter subunit A